MEAKQKAIQAAYGDAWDKIKDYVDENGFTQKDPQRFGFERAFIQTAYKPTWRWRPSALYGLEENGGWTRLDEGFPKDKGNYYVCINGEFDGTIMHSHEICLMGNPLEVSHWRPIDPVRPPIY